MLRAAPMEVPIPIPMNIRPPSPRLKPRNCCHCDQSIRLTRIKNIKRRILTMMGNTLKRAYNTEGKCQYNACKSRRMAKAYIHKCCIKRCGSNFNMALDITFQLT